MTEHPLFCNLDAFTPEDRTRHEMLSQQWRHSLQSIVELERGYGLRFEPTSEMFMLLAELITLERQCCPFFHFELVLEPAGPLWLRLLGSDEVKQLLSVELEGIR